MDGNDRKIEYSKFSSAVHEVFHLNEKAVHEEGNREDTIRQVIIPAYQPLYP